MGYSHNTFSETLDEKKEDEQYALLTSIRASGKRGIDKIKSFTLPTSAKYSDVKTPLFLTTKDTFFATELARVVRLKKVEEYWSIMSELYDLFLAKEAITNIAEIQLIKGKQNSIVETDALPPSLLAAKRAKLSYTTDQEQRQRAVQEIEQVLQNTLKNAEIAKLANTTQDQAAIEPAPQSGLPIATPSTTSLPRTSTRTSNVSFKLYSLDDRLALSDSSPATQDIKVVSVSTRSSTSSNNSRLGKSSLSRIRSNSESRDSQFSGQIGYNLSLVSDSPSHAHHSRNQSDFSAQRMRVNTALGKMAESGPPTPQDPEPSYRCYFTDSASTEDKKTLLNFSALFKDSLSDLLLKDQLLTSGFEFNLIEELVPLINEIFTNLQVNDLIKFNLLYKAEERDAEYLKVITTLNDFIACREACPSRIMKSAVTHAISLRDRLTGLKSLYLAESDPSSPNNATAFHKFDQELIKLYSETEKALHKTHCYSPTVTSDTITAIENLRYVIKSYLTPKQPKKAAGLFANNPFLSLGQTISQRAASASAYTRST